MWKLMIIFLIISIHHSLLPRIGTKTSNGIQSNNNMRIDIDNYYENIQDIYDDMDIILDDNIN